MENNELNQALQDVLRSMPKTVAGGSSGWVNLANYGKELINNGIDFHVYGHQKLREFIESFDFFETYKDETKPLPVYYVRMNTDKAAGETTNHYTRRFTPNNALTSWAFLGHFPTMLESLREMALDEEWDFADNGIEPHPILSNYLKYTFYKLQREGNKIFISADEEYAVFNTGLVDKRYLPIYALFRKNRREDIRQRWYLVDYCIEGEGRAGKTLVSQFSKLPPAAHYFNNISEMVYDTRAGKPVMDIEHIIVERIDRFPYEFILKHAPHSFEVVDHEKLDADARNEYFERLRDAIRDDMESYRNMAGKLEDALTLALRRIKWNFKTAVPVYYPGRDRLCLLIPLCLVRDNVVDAALVVSRTMSGRYQGETIYSLDWAYKCARLIYHIDSDWLKIQGISNKAEEDTTEQTQDVQPE